jgi:2,3-bisphosphoglycerate-independent phosphoglycerate mutase
MTNAPNGQNNARAGKMWTLFPFCNDEAVPMTNPATPVGTASSKKPMVLIILDGFGYREERRDNAIANASKPFWDQLWASSPHMLVSGSGLDVGLPDGQMGNSEVGHMSLGSGRIIYQSITRIDKEIADGEFFRNPAYIEGIDKAIAAGGAVHVMGLLSPGGVHSHESHIFAMIRMAAQRGAKRIYAHAILDGRDTPPRSAQASLEQLTGVCAAVSEKNGSAARIATVIGRYFAMDRDNRWDRVEKAYRLYTESVAEFSATSGVDALQQAYARGEDDEFVKATVVGAPAPIVDGDSIIFMNFRADRAREITRAFVDEPFKGFERKLKPALSSYVMTNEYAADIKAACAYAPDNLQNTLGEYVAELGKTQLRIAETEKYAHVTFFFSGGREENYPGEDRILIKSPDVATYDLQPEMSAPEVTDRLCEAIESGKYDMIACNYANGDMVGHTGVFAAAVKAVEALDACLARVAASIRKVGGQCLITADHGNCEQMVDYDVNQAHTQHTTELVPLVYIGNRNVTFQQQPGRLCDIAPTMLKLMDLPQPADMTGHSLLTIN